MELLAMLKPKLARNGGNMSYSVEDDVLASGY